MAQQLSLRDSRVSGGNSTTPSTKQKLDETQKISPPKPGALLRLIKMKTGEGVGGGSRTPILVCNSLRGQASVCLETLKKGTTHRHVPLARY